MKIFISSLITGMETTRAAAQHELVPYPERRAGDTGNLAVGVKLRTPAQFAGLLYATGFKLALEEVRAMARTVRQPQPEPQLRKLQL